MQMLGSIVCTEWCVVLSLCGCLRTGAILYIVKSNVDPLLEAWEHKLNFNKSSQVCQRKWALRRQAIKYFVIWCQLDVTWYLTASLGLFTETRLKLGPIYIYSSWKILKLKVWVAKSLHCVMNHSQGRLNKALLILLKHYAMLIIA